MKLSIFFLCAESRFTNYIVCSDITNSNLNENLQMQRNKELDELISLINIQSSNVAKKAIAEHGTSFEVILQIVVDYQGLEQKPLNILDVTNVIYTDNEDFYAYYTRVRRFFSNSLKKKGYRLKYFDNKVRI